MLLCSFVTGLIFTQSTASAQTPPITTTSASSTPAAAPIYLGFLTRGTAQGVEVVTVLSGSPVDVAGIRAGDVLIAINGLAVDASQPLASQLAALRAGQPARFTLQRGAQRFDAMVTPGLPPTATLFAGTGLPPTSAAAPTIYTTPISNPGRAAVGFGLVDSGSGIRIEKVVEGSPAARAGLLRDDIVVSIDGAPITSVGAAQALLSGKAPGQSVRIVVQRAGQPLTFTLLLADSGSLAATSVPVIGATTPAAARSPYPGEQIRLGVSYEVLSPALAVARNLPVVSGAYITAVEPDSPAAAAGIQVADIITEVEGDKVDAKRTLALRMLPYGPGDQVLLTVVRGEQTLNISVLLAIRGVA